MEFFDVVRKRRSVRRFIDKGIDREYLEKIIDAARLSATARNEQPWEFVIVTGKGRLAELAQIVSPNGAFLKQAAAGIVVLCRATKYYLEDGSAATQQILLAAADLDIGSCWVAGDKKNYAANVLDFIGAGADLKLVSIIALGYYDGQLEEKEKRPLAKVLHWERYN